MKPSETVKVQVLQAELERICDLRREVRVVNHELKPLEEEVRDLLMLDADVEDGRFAVRLEPVKGCQKPRLVVVEHPPLPLSWSG